VRSDAQSFGSRLAAVLAGELVNKVSVIAAFAWLARTLDPGVYGEIEWALSLMMVFTIAADGGLSTWGAAQIAARAHEAPALVRRIGALRLALAVPAYLILLVVAVSYGGPGGLTLAVYGLVLLLTPLFLQYLFNGLFQSRWAALGNAVRGLTFAAVVFVFVGDGSPPWVVALAEVAGAAALALCGFLLLGHVLGRDAGTLVGFRLDLRAILARSWTIGATEVTWGVHWYAGLILLGYLATSIDAAWHSAALRLVMALHTGVWLYLYVLLPNLARLIADDAPGWRTLVQQSLRLTGWGGWAVALIGTLAADTILTTMFGPPFVAAVPVLQTAVWVVPVAWMSGHIRYSLIAAQHPGRDYRAGLIGAGTTILLSVLLIPTLRSTGTALALLGGTVANAAAAWALGRRVLPAFAFGASVLPSAAGGVVCLSLGWLLASMIGEVLATIVAAAVFGTVALVVERETAGAILGTLTGSNRLKVRNADARS
jgi:O-antigen/teichoic acid export membrane protein